MKLSQVKSSLQNLTDLNFVLPNGAFVPAHFHVTEVGLITKKFIDCGGTVREESVINFQLWEDKDYDHRLAPQKFLSIIELSEKVLELGDLDIEVEYQGSTIGKYDLGHNGKQFILLNKQTDCLAKDQCGVPQEKPKFDLSSLTANACTPGSGCC